ncbi:peptidoglycan DD-metalloendopeptidase family protein [Metabacillus litoralis]|uniref:Peptidoglycan DD-metalloendopeptidase family protein n=1 Tax=Metabacillus litoralis TaxID=152268 RepID=A0A5C6W7B8_9BACI|nr:M23 family metallopeptidase [Metabacillus litoralis]TXC93324.1 peptidoglycan DD-metalloendopeptidase family protein [Metabacillus litoralis]
MQAKIIQIIGIFILGLFTGVILLSTQSASAQTYIEELEDQWVMPVDGKITDTFGTRKGKHKGIDIAAPEGEEIVSVSEGKVTKSYYSDTYGHVVFINHPEGYETVYAHLHKRLVEEGDQVKKGQIIGIIGNTGISTGTHLHFELHKGEWTYDKEHALDPLFVFELPSDPVVQSKGKSANDTLKSKEEEQVPTFAPEKPVSDLHDENDTKLITVEKGDTLWAISLAHNIPINSLKKWNNLNSNTIYPDQQLTVHITNDQSYVVQSGDTIFSIAEEFSVSPESIKTVNQLNNEIIYPEQVLIINENN